MKHYTTASIVRISQLLLIILIFQNPAFTRSEGDLVFQSCSDTSKNYTSGSQFEYTLINKLLPSLVSNGFRNNGFFNNTIGVGASTIYGLVQCRGDVSKAECRTCLNTSRMQSIKGCPNRRAATVGYETCLLRYADFNFFSRVDDYVVEISDPHSIPDPIGYNSSLGELMMNLTSMATSNPSRFDTGYTRFNGISNIYGLVQCTRDLSSADCSSCLQTLITKIPSGCSGKQGGVVGSNCFMRYDGSMLFRPSKPIRPRPPSAAPSPPESPVKISPGSSTAGTKDNTKALIKEPLLSSTRIAAIATPTAVAALLLLGVCVLLMRRKTTKPGTSTTESNTAITDSAEKGMVRNEELLQYDLVTIRNATNDFSNANKIGKGGFGIVYKGVLPHGREIAAKRLSESSRQGSIQFNNEVELLQKFHHPNLVKLLGFCVEGEEKILIYEFLANKSLDKCLYDPQKRSLLDWRQRLNIIKGTALGLHHLHNGPPIIIHRDLKAGNILLDGEMNAKISDFGTARVSKDGLTDENTTKIAGTFGYVAPEYVNEGDYSVKSDVFSFGVLLLEIVTGQKISDCNVESGDSGPTQDHLLSNAWRRWRDGKALELADPSLKDSFSREEVMRCIYTGLLCVQNKSEDRPTMSVVVLMLKSKSYALSLSPSLPGFYKKKRESSHSLTENYMWPKLKQLLSKITMLSSRQFNPWWEMQAPSTSSNTEHNERLTVIRVHYLKEELTRVERAYRMLAKLTKMDTKIR